MKPPIPYFGGKAGMARRIVDLLPAHDIYVEPFAGSLAVLFAKEPSRHEIVNDSDGALTTFFRMLRDRPEDLARVCQLTPYSRREFELAMLDEPGLEDLELARRFWVRVNQSFAKTAGAVTGWSITIARTQATSAGVQNRIRRFTGCAERLSRVSIENKPAVDLIQRLDRPGAVMYLDPPYLGLVRSHQSSSSVEYRNDMAHEDDHTELAKVLRSVESTIVLSGYPSELYDELYAGWWSMDFHVTAHSSNAARGPRSGGVKRTSRIERLWCNRDLDNGRLPLEEIAQ